MKFSITEYAGNLGDPGDQEWREQAHNFISR